VRVPVEVVRDDVLGDAVDALGIHEDAASTIRSALDALRERAP
jgi:hypothetical protein